MTKKEWGLLLYIERNRARAGRCLAGMLEELANIYGSYTERQTEAVKKTGEPVRA